MKNIILILITLFLSSCGWNRIGDLTMVSNRNVDSSKQYSLIERSVVGKAKTKEDDALERAIDQCTEKNKGEYLMNAKIYVKDNGKWIKVEGDVWGFSSTDVNVQASVTKDIKFENGNLVTFKIGGKLVEGTIIGINTNNAIVELKNGTKREVAYDELTKLEK